MKMLQYLYQSIWEYIPLAIGAAALATPLGAHEGPPMQTARMSHYLVPGPALSVLAIGGHGSGFVALSNYEVWDPSSDEFTQYSLPGPADNSAVAQLEDGRYLLVGSAADDGIAPGYQHAILIDPATNSAVFAGTPTQARMNGSAARLNDGRVLVVGGWRSQYSSYYGDLYDPDTDSFTGTGPLRSARSHALVFPTPDGGALLCGGKTPDGGEITGHKVERYEPATNTFAKVRVELVTDDPGWEVPVAQKVDNIEELRRTDGTYACLFHRVVNNVTEWAVFIMDPATREFTRLTAPDAFPEDEYPFVFTVDSGKDHMYLAIGSNFETGVGCNFRLYTVNLSTGAINQHSEQHSVSDRYLYYSRALYLPGSGLMISGGCTVLGHSTNSNPSNATYLIKADPLPILVLEINTAVDYTGVELRFVAHSGHTYQCQYTETLNSANWQAVPGEPDIVGDDQEHAIFVSFEERQRDHEFYRLAIVP